MVLFPDSGLYGCALRSWGVRMALYTKFGLRGSFTNDPPHRRHNDCMNAYKHSGLTLLRLEAGIVYTFSLGPFKSDGWHGCLVQAAKQWHATSTFRDDLFQLLYPHIVHDKYIGKPPGDYGSEKHMREVWDDIPRCAGILRQDFSMKFSRWYNFVEKTNAFRRWWSTVLAVLLYYGMFKGWLTGISDLPFLQALPHYKPPGDRHVGAWNCKGAQSALQCGALPTSLTREIDGIAARWQYVSGRRFFHDVSSVTRVAVCDFVVALQGLRRWSETRSRTRPPARRRTPPQLQRPLLAACGSPTNS